MITAGDTAIVRGSEPFLLADRVLILADQAVRADEIDAAARNPDVPFGTMAAGITLIALAVPGWCMVTWASRVFYSLEHSRYAAIGTTTGWLLVAGTVALGGPAKSRERHHARGKLLARERVSRLLDEGSPFIELAPLAAEGLYDGDAPAAGVIAGIGMAASD